VGGAGVGSPYNTPPAVIPQVGQVSEYDTDSPSSVGWRSSQVIVAGFHAAMGAAIEESSHVLDQDVAGAELADGVGDVEPQPGPGTRPHPRPQPGVGKVLAREAGGEPVHPGHPGPVDRGDIAQVRCCGVVVGEDFGGVGVGVGVPQDPAAQDGP
jgi:hypothetical protein